MWAMIVPAIPVLAVAFEISPGTAAQIVTASGLGRFVGLPIAGAVLDRLGARWALIAGPALACIAALLAAVVPWFVTILALVFLIGVAESVWVLAREMAGIDMARPDQRVIVIGDAARAGKSKEAIASAFDAALLGRGAEANL